MTVDDVQVFDYRDEVLVELQTTDDYGALEVITYQFAVDGDRILAPKGRVEDEHVRAIQEGLDQKGYAYTDLGATLGEPGSSSPSR